MGSPIAAGAHIEVRDAVWRVVQVTPTSTGTHAWYVVGVSEVVRDHEAIFLEDFEPDVRVLDPRDTQLVADPSSGHRAGLLHIEAHLREVPPEGGALCVGHRAAMDVLDYQLDPARLALAQLRARLLIADAVGLGKTLEAGILLAELIRRGKARRILVVTLKSMLTQFQKELWTRFTIPLVRLDTDGLRRIRERLPTNGNPFHYYDKVIISIDTLRGTKDRDQHRTHLEASRWDVIVIDEAHNVAERGNDLSRRARVAALLARNPGALILLSATPHDGKAASFASLMNMLDPTAIADPEAYTPADIKGLFIRRFKKDVQAQVRERYPERRIERAPCAASPAEEAAYAALADLALERERRAAGTMLFRYVVEKALFSSPAACLATIERRLETLAGVAAERRDAAAERDTDRLGRLAERVRAIDAASFTRYQRLLALLRDKRSEWHFNPRKGDDRLVIFTERLETMTFLAERLREDLGLDDKQVRTLHGTMGDTELQTLVEDFGKDKAKVRLLVATDVAAEGLNLHFLCRRLIHFDVPWSLLVFQQRNGRIDRYGQTREPRILYLLTESTHEQVRGDVQVLERLIARDEQAMKNIGDPSALQGVLDVDAQELLTAEVMAEGTTGPEIDRRLHLADVDPLEALLNAGAPEGAPVAPPKDPPSLFASDFDLLSTALELFRADGVSSRVYPDRRWIEIDPSLDLARRLERLPIEVQPADGVLCLTSDPDVMKQAIMDARAEESAWPKAHFLWPLHPILGWVVDRTRGRFTRQTAPVLTVERGLAPGERVLLVSGLVPNHRGQAVVHRWYAVTFAGDRLSKVEDLAPLLERTRLGREPLANPGEPADLDDLQSIVPRAVEEVSGKILVELARVDADLVRRREEELARLRTLRGRREATVARQFTGKRGAKAEADRGREARRVEEVFRSFETFVREALTTQPRPFVQVVAALVRPAADRKARATGTKNGQRRSGKGAR